MFGSNIVGPGATPVWRSLPQVEALSLLDHDAMKPLIKIFLEKAHAACSAAGAEPAPASQAMQEHAQANLCLLEWETVDEGQAIHLIAFQSDKAGYLMQRFDDSTAPKAVALLGPKGPRWLPGSEDVSHLTSLTTLVELRHSMLQALKQSTFAVPPHIEPRPSVEMSAATTQVLMTGTGTQGGGAQEQHATCDGEPSSPGAGSRDSTEAGAGLSSRQQGNKLSAQVTTLLATAPTHKQSDAGPKPASASSPPKPASPPGSGTLPPARLKELLNKSLQVLPPGGVAASATTNDTPAGGDVLALDLAAPLAARLDLAMPHKVSSSEGGAQQLMPGSGASGELRVVGVTPSVPTSPSAAPVAVNPTTLTINTAPTSNTTTTNQVVFTLPTPRGTAAAGQEGVKSEPQAAGGKPGIEGVAVPGQVEKVLLAAAMIQAAAKLNQGADTQAPVDVTTMNMIKEKADMLKAQIASTDMAGLAPANQLALQLAAVMMNNPAISGSAAAEILGGKAADETNGVTPPKAEEGQDGDEQPVEGGSSAKTPAARPPLPPTPHAPVNSTNALTSQGAGTYHTPRGVMNEDGTTSLDLTTPTNSDFSPVASRGRPGLRAVRAQRYTGVYRQVGRWRAQFSHGGLVHQLGMYDTEEKAAQAWDRVAWVYRGRRADLNFPDLVHEYDTEESKARVHELMDERMAMKKPRGKAAAAAITAGVALGAIQGGSLGGMFTLAQQLMQPGLDAGSKLGGGEPSNNNQGDDVTTTSDNPTTTSAPPTTVDPTTTAAAAAATNPLSLLLNGAAAAHQLGLPLGAAAGLLPLAPLHMKLPLMQQGRGGTRTKGKIPVIDPNGSNRELEGSVTRDEQSHNPRCDSSEGGNGLETGGDGPQSQQKQGGSPGKTRDSKRVANRVTSGGVSKTKGSPPKSGDKQGETVTPRSGRGGSGGSTGGGRQSGGRKRGERGDHGMAGDGKAVAGHPRHNGVVDRSDGGAAGLAEEADNLVFLRQGGMEQPKRRARARASHNHLARLSEVAWQLSSWDEQLEQEQQQQQDGGGYELVVHVAQQQQQQQEGAQEGGSRQAGGGGGSKGSKSIGKKSPGKSRLGGLGMPLSVPGMAPGMYAMPHAMMMSPGFMPGPPAGGSSKKKSKGGMGRVPPGMHMMPPPGHPAAFMSPMGMNPYMVASTGAGFPGMVSPYGYAPHPHSSGGMFPHSMGFHDDGSGAEMAGMVPAYYHPAMMYPGSAMPAPRGGGDDDDDDDEEEEEDEDGEGEQQHGALMTACDMQHLYMQQLAAAGYGHHQTTGMGGEEDDDDDDDEEEEEEQQRMPVTTFQAPLVPAKRKRAKQ